MTYKRVGTHRGFSLIELIVAVGLFAVIMSISTTAYLIMINANRLAQNLATGTNNLSYALENMTRNMRTGVAYGGCGTDVSSFTFTDADGVETTYSLVQSVSDSTKGKIVRTVGGAPTDLTDESVDISTLSFTCTGTTPGDGEQSHVSIVVSGTVGVSPGGGGAIGGTCGGEPPAAPVCSDYDLNQTACQNSGCTFNPGACSGEYFCSVWNGCSGKECKDAEAGCWALKGCEWQGAAKNCIRRGNAQGRVLCSEEFSPSTCSSAPESCSLTGSTCTGGTSPTPCGDISTELSCQSATGCSWTPNVQTVASKPTKTFNIQTSATMRKIDL